MNGTETPRYPEPPPQRQVQICQKGPKTLAAFEKRSSHISCSDWPRTSQIARTVHGMFVEAFAWPRLGAGVKNGESVSTSNK